MGPGVVDVVEFDLGGELVIRRAGEEVQAAVRAQHAVGQLHHGGHRGEDEDVVVALAAGELHQRRPGVDVPGVDVVQFHALLRSFLFGQQLGGPIQTALIDIGDDQQAGAAVAVDRIVDGCQTHGAHRRHHDHVAALLDPHLMGIDLFGGHMEHTVAGAGDAGQRLRQRRTEKRLALVGTQAAVLHDFLGEDDVGGVAAAQTEGITQIPVAGQVQRRLHRKFLAGLELIFPLLAHFHDLAAELMADDDGIRRHIVGDPLVGCALLRRFVGAHANAVGHDLAEDLVGLQFREFKLLQPQVFDSVKTHRFGFHGMIPPFKN